MKKILGILVSLSMVTVCLSGCGSTPENESAGNASENQESQEPVAEEPVTLTIAGPWEDCTAIEMAAASFTEQNPNCHITYEYLQDFDDSVLVRLAGTEDKIDFMLTNNIQKGSDLMEYALDFSSVGEDLDLSDTFDGLVNNFKLQSSDTAEQEQLYAIPLGADMRGMYVNVTLLNSLNLEVPTNIEQLLSDCKVLSENGYIPLQGNPGIFAQQLFYPYICNLIVNADDYEQTFQMVNQRENSATELFKTPMELLYTMVENNYYNYKYCETELGTYLDVSSEGYSRNFLNLAEAAGGYEKKDDIGQVAFMPATQSMGNTLEKMKEDYHSEIEYEFILSPVSEEGGFAYLSPARAIAVNKNSDHIDWCIRFLNYLFDEKNNEAFAEEMGIVPNTKNALSILSETYNIPESNISELGQVTFEYDFFTIINDTLVEISKSNNPKYMEQKEDGSVQMYPFSYYMDNFANRFAEAEN